MDWLNTISKEHKKWVHTINSFGEFSFAEDIVQEMYLKLYDMSTSERNPLDRRCVLSFDIKERVLKEDGTCNYSYIWFVLRSVYLDYVKNRDKVFKVSLEDVVLITENTDEVELAYGRIIEKIEREKESWNRYDMILFDTYSRQDLSMRDLAEMSEIGLKSVFDTLKYCKDRLKTAVGEDYEDFINKEYELI